MRASFWIDRQSERALRAITLDIELFTEVHHRQSIDADTGPSWLRHVRITRHLESGHSIIAHYANGQLLIGRSMLRNSKSACSQQRTLIPTVVKSALCQSRTQHGPSE
jgi:hypothetical protein